MCIRDSSKPLKNIQFSSIRPLLVPSIQEKHYKSFGFTIMFDLNMKMHFKTTWRKRLRIPFRTKLRRYSCINGSPHWPQILSTIHGFFTLAANNKRQIIRSKKKNRSTGVSIVKTNSSFISTKTPPTMTRPEPHARDMLPDQKRLTKHLDLIPP